MLTQLNIINFLLIDKLEINFNAGLTVITGETGSGKSIIIDALMLLFGARASSDIIRKGTEQAIFAAEFNIATNKILSTWLNENDLNNIDDPNLLLCRRVIDVKGKSKNYINGIGVTSSQMKVLGEILIDIHTQHSSIMLMKSDNQRVLLDEYAGVSGKVKDLSIFYKQISQLEKSIHEAQNHSRELSIRQEILQEKINLLLELNLVENEWEHLNENHSRLSNAQLILQELDCVVNYVDGEDGAILSQVTNIQQRLGKIVQYCPKLNDQIQLLDSVYAELQELSHNLATIANGVDQDQSALVQIDERINQIFDVARRERISPEQIPTKLTEWQNELIELNQSIDLEALQKSLDEVKSKYMKLAQVISKQRNQASSELSAKVTEIIHKLSINGEFKICLNPTSGLSLNGLEQIEYQIRFNKGMELQSLAKVASGGELSRTALALYVVLSIHNPPEIIVFDEIDVGIGGKVAAVVGELLAMLGMNKQIICITHQPQTASYGDNHMVVSKIDTENATLSKLEYVENDLRTDEIARMLGGINITNATKIHAEELLHHANIAKSV